MAGNVPLPAFTTVSNLPAGGSPIATYTLLYYSPSGSTLTSWGGLVIAPGASTPSSTSASTSASPDVNRSSLSSITTSSLVPGVGASSTSSPVPPANDITTPILSTPSSTGPSPSPSPSLSASQRARPSTSTSSHPAKQTTSVTPAPFHSNRLANGTVAGIVIGVALGVAIITFLATFLAIRRRGGSRGKRNRQRAELDGGSSSSARHQILSSEPKQPLVTQTSSGSNSFDDFLPQSADDKTVQNEVKTLLDQIELYVENFYQNTQASGSRLAKAELAMFDSPYLPSSLASLLPQTNNSILLIKHALAHFIIACITTPSDTDWSLLPKDFVLLPNAVRAGGSAKSTKQGE